MEARDIIFSIVMIVSSFVLTYKWMSRFSSSNYAADAVVVLSAMVLIGSLAAMILSVDMRMRRIESMLEAKERALRINILSVEENLDRKLNVVLNKTNNTAEEMSRRMYR
ncbi:MAG: hypothetical protein KAR76_05280 [Methanosarcinales archaeon]|nr:hypothetical protein [Methanosarcinales archaeon]